jgi:hypothetical protein
MAPASAQNPWGLAIFGEFFLGLVFANLSAVPRLGQEDIQHGRSRDTLILRLRKRLPRSAGSSLLVESL